MNKPYEVTANIIFDGAVYQIGETIELSDADATPIQRYLKPLDNSSKEEQLKETSTVDYDELTTNELKQLVEERNIDVKATGKHGAVKSDYVKALQKSDE